MVETKSKTRNGASLPSAAEQIEKAVSSASDQSAPVDASALPERYGLILRGDVFAPEYKDGDVLEFSSTESWAAGDIVVLHGRTDRGPSSGPAIFRVKVGNSRHCRVPMNDHPDSTAHPVLIVERPGIRGALGIRLSLLAAVHKCIENHGPAEARYEPR